MHLHRSHRRAVASIAATGLVGALLAVPGTASQAAEAVNTPNMEHVANLQYPLRAYPEGDVFAYDPTTRQGGTDMETITIVTDHDGDGTATARDFVAAGSYRNGLQLIDVTDPTAPVLAQTYDCGIAQGDVQLIQRDGSTYVAYAQDDIESDALYTSACFQEGFALHGLATPTSPGNADAINAEAGGLYGTFIIDITNPYDDEGADRVRTVGWARHATGSHNATVSPDGLWLFNSNQDLIAKTPIGGQSAYRIEVFSLADLTNPVKVAEVPLSTGTGPHDITFNADGTRAYVAAISHTVILDTTPLASGGAPVVIGTVVDPAISIHHQADPVSVGGRDFMVVSDELAGVIEGSVVCPGGGLHIYDVTGDLEKNPVKVGFFEINQIAPPGQAHARCTAHVFKAYPDQGIMTIAWYGAGVRVLDISNLAGVGVGVDPTVGGANVLGIREIGSYWFPETETQVGSQTWAAKIHRFEADGSAYIFANDLDRGFDVYRWDGTAYDGVAGSFLSPQDAAELAIERGVTTASISNAQSLPYCVVLPDEA